MVHWILHYFHEMKLCWNHQLLNFLKHDAEQNIIRHIYNSLKNVLGFLMQYNTIQYVLYYSYNILYNMNPIRSK